jgi:uncharacterized protein YjbI with pentapeptide repeats
MDDIIKWLASLPPIPVFKLVLYIFASVLSLLLLGYLGYHGWKLFRYLLYQAWKPCRKLRRFWRSLDRVRVKDRFEIKNDFIKTTAQILGGAFFILTIVVAYLNLTATQEKNVTDLYTKAIEQLGSEKLEVRLGGIYALERIARDSKKDHWTIMEVLTAYVRERAPATAASKGAATKEASPVPRKKVPKKPEEQTSVEKPEPKPKADIQAVLTVLGRTAIPFAPKGEKRRLDLRSTNLAGADLNKADLQGAIFNKANLQGADLEKANLQGADLILANLQGADLEKANLQGAFLREANLQGTYLEGANLQGASLFLANLQGANLWGDNLQGADLGGANLQGAVLMGANLRGADLRGPKTLEGFTWGAKGLASEQVEDAYWDETTKWPEGFSPPAPERLPPKEGKQGKE